MWNNEYILYFFIKKQKPLSFLHKLNLQNFIDGFDLFLWKPFLKP